MKILIKGAGDLATGIGWELYQDGHEIIMTDLSIPLAVRRTVSFSRAIYEGEATVEGVTAVLVRNYEEAKAILAERKVPVIADPDAKIRLDFQPDVVVDGIMAKRNVNTRIDDAKLVLAIGPGFTAGKDCHCVIETMRGAGLGKCIWNGHALEDTGIPGEVGGYTIERLIKASADGIMKPVAKIGDIVDKGQIVAFTGGEPVYSQLHGIIRGMLQADVKVRKGMKIGDVDARLREELAVTISDKSHRMGVSIREAIQTVFS